MPDVVATGQVCGVNKVYGPPKASGYAGGINIPSWLFPSDHLSAWWNLWTTEDAMSCKARADVYIYHFFSNPEDFTLVASFRPFLHCVPIVPGCAIEYDTTTGDIETNPGTVSRGPATVTLDTSPFVGDDQASFVMSMQASLSGQLTELTYIGIAKWQCSHRPKDDGSVPVEPPREPPPRKHPELPPRVPLGWLAGIAALTAGLFGWLAASGAASSTSPTTRTIQPAPSPTMKPTTTSTTERGLTPPAPASMTQAQAAQAYESAATPVNASQSAFYTEAENWDASTTDTEAQQEAAQLVSALNTAEAQLDSIAASYPQAATQVRAVVSALTTLNSDLSQLANLQTIGVDAWAQKYDADRNTLTTVSNAARQALGLPATTS